MPSPAANDGGDRLAALRSLASGSTKPDPLAALRALAAPKAASGPSAASSAPEAQAGAPSSPESGGLLSRIGSGIASAAHEVAHLWSERPLQNVGPKPPDVLGKLGGALGKPFGVSPEAASQGLQLLQPIGDFGDIEKGLLKLGRPAEQAMAKLAAERGTEGAAARAAALQAGQSAAARAASGGLPSAQRAALRRLAGGSRAALDQELAQRASQVEGVRSASEGLGRLGGRPEGLPTVGAAGKLRGAQEAAAESVRPGAKLPSALEAALSRAEASMSAAGPEAGGAHLAALQPVAGAGLGAATGATQGKTVKERIRNALLGAAAGAIAPIAAKRLIETLRSSPEAMQAIGSEDDLLRQFRDLEAKVSKGRAPAAGRSAEDFLRTRTQLRGPALDEAKALGKLLPGSGLKPDEEALLQSEFRRATAAMGIEKTRVPLSDVKKEAEAIGQDPARLTAALGKKGASGAEQLAMVSTFRRNTQEMAALRRALDRGVDAAGDPLTSAEHDRIAAELTRRAKVNNALMGSWSEAGTYHARALQARQAEAFATDDPFAMLSLAREVKGSGLTEPQQTHLLSLVNAGKKAEAGGYIAKLRKATPLDKTIATLKGFMLTNPATGAVITTSNVVKTGMRQIERRVAAGADYLLGAARGRYTGEIADAARTTHAPTGDAFMAGIRQIPSETARMFRGEPGRLTEETRQAWAGRRVNWMEPGEKLTWKTAPKWAVDKTVNGVYGAVAAAHSVFRLPEFEQSLRDQALAIAAREGFTKGTPEWAQRVADLRAAPTAAMHNRALAESAQEFFLQPTGIFEKMRSLVGDAKYRHGAILRGVTETTVPFSRIMFGLADQMTDLTGIGLLRGAYDTRKLLRFAKVNGLLSGLSSEEAASVRKVMDELQHEAAGHFARGATGLGTSMLLGWLLGKAGRISTAYPDTPRERQLWQAEGRRENSFLLKGKWRSLDMLGPYGLALAMGASVRTILASDDPAPTYSKVLKSLGAIATTLGDMTIGQGVQEIGQLAEGQPGALGRLAETPIKAVVPNLIQHLAHVQDPTKRYASGELQGVQRNVPFLQEALPAKRSALGGQKLKGPGGVWANLFSPSRGAVPDLRKGSPVLAEVDRLKTFPLPPKKPDGLDNGTWRQIRSHVEQSYGEHMLTVARQIMGSWAYANANDEEKKHMLESAWTKEKDRLNRQMKYELVQAGKLQPTGTGG